MNLISGEHLSRRFGERIIFEDINFGIASGQKIALVGVNGSGKSTLMKIMAGVEPPDTGSVSVNKEATIGYLPQQPVLPEELSVRDAVFYSDNPRLQLIRKYEDALRRAEEDPTQQDALAPLMEQMDAQQAWDMESRIQIILGKLGLYELEKKVSELSGGQRKRVAMARMLIEQPDLIILDEPTNHLDLDTIEWLENFLATEAMAMLLVTHDRYFLERVTTEIVELDNGKLFRYQGNYSQFLEKKAERHVQEAASVDKARNLMRKELDWMRRQPKARGTKAKYRVDAFYDLQDKASQNTKQDEVNLSVIHRRLGGKILEVKDLNKAFAERQIVEDFSYIFKKKDRIGIVGKNGSGKSTLLNMLTGELEPDSGEIDKGVNTVFGYYTQEEQTFKEDDRVIDVVKAVAEVIEMSDGSTLTAGSLLTRFLFPPKTHYQVIGKLSGGERRRLQLLRVLMRNPNFLILDEPTNDLDIMTLNVLEDFLMEFQGCLLLVSHDRYFMDKLVEHLFVFEEGEGLRDFPGNYTDYREEQKELDALEKEERKEQERQQAAAPAKQPGPAENKQKLSFKEKRELETIEAEMETLEGQKEELEAKMNSGITDHEELATIAASIEQITTALESKGDRWLELSERA